MAGTADHFYALNGAQQHIWLAECIGAPGVAYHAGEYIEIHGPVDPTRFGHSLRQAE